MILGNNSAQTNAFSNEDIQQNSFKVIAGSKMFQVLSSKIYKNKIRAVVRELVCNCVDAHVINGNKEPFEVKAPNSLTPTFEVRDYGPGLSDSDMVELYTTYFASSKAHRNDQIGAFGLGSKSPFSYTDTFSTISYFDGEITVFVATMVNGEPKLTMTHKEPMKPEDKTGLHVIIPVRADDHEKFISEIKYVMRPFNPNSYDIRGCSHIDITPYPEFDSYLFDKGQYGTKSGLYALYGNILYPIDEVEGVKDATDWIRNVGGRAIIFKFEPGTLDIQPSREELSLDEVTIKNVVSTVSKINEMSILSTKEDFCKLTTVRSALRFLWDLNNTCSQVLLKHWALIPVEDRLIKADLSKLISKRTTLYAEHVENLGHVNVKYLSKLGVSKVAARNERLVAPRSEGQYVRANETSLGQIFHIKSERVTVFINDSKHSDAILKWLYEQNKVDSRIMVLIAAYGTHYIDNQKKIISEIMEDDEVVYIRSSEYLESFLEKRKQDKSSAPKRAYVSRPAAPNGYRYKLDSDGNWSYKTLYMSSEELDNLTGNVTVTSYKDVCVFNKEFTRVGNCDIFKIKQFANYLFPEYEFVELRPQAARRVLEKNPNVNCAVVSLSKELNRRFVAASGILPGVGSSDIGKHAGKLINPKLLIANNSDDMDLRYAAGVFVSMYFNIPNDPEFVASLTKSLEEAFKSADEAADKLAKDFKKNHPMAYFCLDRWNVDKKVIDDINKYLKMLEV